MNHKKSLHKHRSQKLVDFKNIPKLSARLKKDNKKTVFTLGTFDLLNPGQCRYLAGAKSFGDILVVGVATDVSVRSIKGEGYPLVKEDVRGEMVTYLECVD